MQGQYLVLFLTILVVVITALIVISISTEESLTENKCTEAGGIFCKQLECPEDAEKLGDVREGTKFGVCCKGGCG